MPTYIVTLHDGQSKDELKEEVKNQGGEITHDYSIINGFAVKFPNDHVNTLEAHPHVKHVELDQEVTTQ